jgi:hypothetical protein
VRAVPVLDVLLVILEFAGLFLATWIAWFAVVTVYQILTRRTDWGRGWTPGEAASNADRESPPPLVPGKEPLHR